jgi:hypothetical protein
MIPTSMLFKIIGSNPTEPVIVLFTHIIKFCFYKIYFRHLFSNLILNNIVNRIDAIIELENSIISMILASARLINSPSSEKPINLPSPKNTAKNTPIERTILIIRILFILQ